MAQLHDEDDPHGLSSFFAQSRTPQRGVRRTKSLASPRRATLQDVQRTKSLASPRRATLRDEQRAKSHASERRATLRTCSAQSRSPLRGVRLWPSRPSLRWGC